jgi:hypothetical protein
MQTLLRAKPCHLAVETPPTSLSRHFMTWMYPLCCLIAELAKAPLSPEWMCERRMPYTRLRYRMLEIGRLHSEQGACSCNNLSKNLCDYRKCHQGSSPIASPSSPISEAVGQPDLLNVQVSLLCPLHHVCLLCLRSYINIFHK